MHYYSIKSLLLALVISLVLPSLIVLIYLNSGIVKITQQSEIQSANVNVQMDKLEYLNGLINTQTEQLLYQRQLMENQNKLSQALQKTESVHYLFLDMANASNIAAMTRRNPAKREYIAKKQELHALLDTLLDENLISMELTEKIKALSALNDELIDLFGNRNKRPAIKLYNERVKPLVNDVSQALKASVSKLNSEY